MAGQSLRGPAGRVPRPSTRLVPLLVWAVLLVLVPVALVTGAPGSVRSKLLPHGSLAHLSAQPAGSGARLALLAEAHAELAAMRDTEYQHDTDVDAVRGEFYYDCSGFLDYALGRAAPAALRALPVTASAGRPLAQDFEHTLRAGRAGPWRSVATPADLRPGDVVAWLATPDSRTRDTGHVVIVLDTPVRNPNRADEWLVKVADSTVSPHADDSRGTEADGLGTGTIGLAVDGADHAVGFYWRGGVSKVAKTTEVALGDLS
ncbi:MAG TPA: hypothetical protein VH141_34525 [Pseudonocardia sp.]|nr:hypothetical protein [Pseudonocardia sp.]